MSRFDPTPLIMARSSYIYIVTHPDGPQPVLAAFTVKREMLCWLEDIDHPRKSEFLFQRFEDSPCDVDTPVPIDPANPGR